MGRDCQRGRNDGAEGKNVWGGRMPGCLVAVLGTQLFGRTLNVAGRCIVPVLRELSERRTTDSPRSVDDLMRRCNE